MTITFAIGCKDPTSEVSSSSGWCLGQLGAIEAGHLPRQYVQPDGSPFAFSINDNCFAATALVELTRAFQYEKDTMVSRFIYHFFALPSSSLDKVE